MKQQKFIEKANQINGDKYNYSLVVYKSSKEKVAIICPEHGVFYQTPNNHINKKTQCPKCRSDERILTIENFIKKANKKHKEFYNYSLVKYKTSKDKIEIICPVHGIFRQTVNSHLSGSGCKKCYFDKISFTHEVFIKKAKKVHNNKYDYSSTEYNGMHKKIKIICPMHGVFKQLPSNHISGAGCLKCKEDNEKLKINEITVRSKAIHGNIYDYSLVDYKNSKDKVNIICRTHGVFKQSIECHLRGQGCPKCKSSHGERKIRMVLEKLGIFFEEQKFFKDCINLKTKRKLPFDFFIKTHNICIEFDGIQHYKSKSFGEKDKKRKQKNFLKIQENDKIKNLYCKKNSINLLRIKYCEIDNVENILINYVKKIKKKDCRIY